MFGLRRFTRCLWLTQSKQQAFSLSLQIAYMILAMPCFPFPPVLLWRYQIESEHDERLVFQHVSFIEKRGRMRGSRALESPLGALEALLSLPFTSQLVLIGCLLFFFFYGSYSARVCQRRSPKSHNLRTSSELMRRFSGFMSAEGEHRWGVRPHRSRPGASGLHHYYHVSCHPMHHLSPCRDYHKSKYSIKNEPRDRRTKFYQ